MTFLQRLFAPVEAREGIYGIQDPAVPLSAMSIVDLTQGAPIESGAVVTEQTALRMSAVYRAVGLIAGSAAATPLPVYRKAAGRRAVDVPLLADPCPGRTPFEWWEAVYLSLLTNGNAYGLKRKDGLGRITSIGLLNPAQVRVFRSEALVSDVNPDGKGFSVWGTGKKAKILDVLSPDEMFHIPGMGFDGLTGVSPIRMAAQGIGMSLQAERYQAKQFSQGALMSGILQSEQRLNDDQAEAVATRWRQKVAGMARAHDVIAMGSGLKFQSIQFPNQDLQMMELRKFQVDEIARIYGVPPYLLGSIEKSTSWGTGLEQQSTAFVKFTLRPWLTRVEQRVNAELLDAGLEAKYDTRDLMRGDSKQRTDYYQSMRMMGALNADEIRADEGLDPLPDGKGQTYLQPVNMAAAPGSSDAPASTPTDDGEDPNV